MVADGGLVWVVANSRRPSTENFEQQAASTLARLEQALVEAGTSKTRLLSVQIFLSDINQKNVFDGLWNEWIGNDADNWPQRICIQAGLSGGLLIEIQAVALR